MITVAEKCVLIGIVGKPYDFVGQKDGKQMKGTSYRATLSSGGEIFVVKTNESVFKDVGSRTNLSGVAVLRISNWDSAGKSEVRLFLERFDYVE